MYHYCNIWKLQLNAQKTKVVIFGKKKSIPNTTYSFGRDIIGVVDEYTYLGILFKSNGNLKPCLAQLRNIACKAMYSLLKKSKRLGLDIDVQMHLFDSVVMPIALYGCEVWGFLNIDLLEKLHLLFCKMILKVKKSTPTCMVLGELGRFPVQYNVDLRLLCFWFKTIKSSSNKFSLTFYKLLYKLHTLGIYSNEWLKKVECTLTACGMSEFWLNQNLTDNMTFNTFKIMCRNKLKLFYTDKWLNSVSQSNKGLFYKEYKTELKFEYYLVEMDVSLRYFLVKFRTSNHRLHIEEGRFNQIARADRKCLVCDSNDIGNEYHYICICPKFDEIRKKTLKKDLIRNPSVKKFCDLFSMRNKTKLRKLAIMIKVILNNV